MSVLARPDVIVWVEAISLRLLRAPADGTLAMTKSKSLQLLCLLYLNFPAGVKNNGIAPSNITF